jgi:hypothetical protein
MKKHFSYPEKGAFHMPEGGGGTADEHLYIAAINFDIETGQLTSK